MAAAPGPAPADLAASRAAVYRLLGRLHLLEVDAPALAALRDWPAFRGTLAAAGGDADLLGRLRAEYARLFLLNAYPYESVYVEAAAMLGGESSAAVEQAYREAGFEPAGVPRPGAPDHVGAEMLFLAALVDEEPAARAAFAARAGQRRFLEAHLAACLPPFALAVARDARHPFYRALAQETLSFVLSDLDRLAGAAGSVACDAAEEPGGGEAPLEERDLAGVAAYLAAPVHAGFLLSREELHRLAAELAVPLAMVERPRMVEMLFEGAARFGQLPALLDRLEGQARDAAARYTALAADNPGAAPVLAPWRRRAAATADALLAMRRAAAGAA